jgi:hypothetical protein
VLPHRRGALSTASITPVLIDGAVVIGPVAGDLDVGLTDEPAITRPSACLARRRRSWTCPLIVAEPALTKYCLCPAALTVVLPRAQEGSDFGQRCEVVR